MLVIDPSKVCYSVYANWEGGDYGVYHQETLAIFTDRTIAELYVLQLEEEMELINTEGQLLYDEQEEYFKKRFKNPDTDDKNIIQRVEEFKKKHERMLKFNRDVQFVIDHIPFLD